MKNELTTEHDIYISIGLKHPMKPTDCRDLIDSLIVENFMLDSWGTHTKDEWIDVVNECQEKVDSLITTIESLQESFDRQVEGHKYTAGRYSDEMKETKRLNALIESQKEEIEEFKEFQSEVADEYSWMNRLLNSYLKSENRLIAEIESLKAITELAVKGLKKCLELGECQLDYGGSIDCLEQVANIALTTLSQIERLSHA